MKQRSLSVRVAGRFLSGFAIVGVQLVFVYAEKNDIIWLSNALISVLWGITFLGWMTIFRWNARHSAEDVVRRAKQRGLSLFGYVSIGFALCLLAKYQYWWTLLVYGTFVVYSLYWRVSKSEKVANG